MPEDEIDYDELDRLEDEEEKRLYEQTLEAISRLLDKTDRFARITAIPDEVWQAALAADEAAARQKPATPEDRYRMAAAAELLAERAALQRGLSAAGARIIDRPPDDAVLAAVNAYVEVKQRHLL